MRGLLSGLLRAQRAFSPRTGVLTQQRAGYINSRPPKDNIGPVESAFVMTVMFMAILGPSGWILAHVDQYKSR